MTLLTLVSGWGGISPAEAQQARDSRGRDRGDVKEGKKAAPEKRRYSTVPAPNGIRIRRFVTTRGKKPVKDSRVLVHYHGTLADGTVFDSSVERGRPANFGLDQVIPCWTEALTRMREGEKAVITCPPNTAYGLRGSPPTIPANAKLTFEVELISVR